LVFVPTLSQTFLGARRHRRYPLAPGGGVGASATVTVIPSVAAVDAVAIGEVVTVQVVGPSCSASSA